MAPLSYFNTPVTGICCPICRFSNGKLLYAVTSEEAAQHFVLKEVEPKRNEALAGHIARLWGKQTCHLISCDSCGFIFSHPFVAGDSAFYTLAYQRTGYPKWKWEYQQTRDAIAEIASRPGQAPLKLLEIGAGDGAFVRKISPEIVAKENILCIEFSEYGRNRILEYGIDCKGDDIRSLDATDHSDKFDIICLFQVLEHMDRLEELCKQLNRLSSNHSHFFISAPNAGRIAFNETNGCLIDMPPNHIGRWNRSAFERMGETFGWTVAEYKVEPLNIMETLKQQIAYRYLKRSQDSSTSANSIERISSEKIRGIMRSIGAAAYSLGKLSVLFDAVCDKNLGDSQWIHFVKARQAGLER